MSDVTTAARRLARQHNNDENLDQGIYEVEIKTGRIGVLVATYAAKQYPPEMVDYTGKALLRISYGRMSEKEAQRFIDEKGQGW